MRYNKYGLVDKAGNPTTSKALTHIGCLHVRPDNGKLEAVQELLRGCGRADGRLSRSGRPQHHCHRQAEEEAGAAGIVPPRPLHRDMRVGLQPQLQGAAQARWRAANRNGCGDQGPARRPPQPPQPGRPEQDAEQNKNAWRCVSGGGGNEVELWG